MARYMSDVEPSYTVDPVSPSRAHVGSSVSTYVPATWTNYKRTVTIDGSAYEELSYQFVSRKRKLTIHRRLGRDDGGNRRRRFQRTVDEIKENSVKNMKVVFYEALNALRCDMCVQLNESVYV